MGTNAEPGRTWLPLCVGIAASALAVGVPYWSIPYAEVNLPNALLGPGLAAVAVAAFLLQASRCAPFWITTWATGAAVVAAVVARVLVEGIRDPTSHNLWPLEVVIALVVGLAPAAAGAGLGSLAAGLHRMLQRRG